MKPQHITIPYIFVNILKGYWEESYEFVQPLKKKQYDIYPTIWQFRSIFTRIHRDGHQRHASQCSQLHLHQSKRESFYPPQNGNMKYNIFIKQTTYITYKQMDKSHRHNVYVKAIQNIPYSICIKYKIRLNQNKVRKQW